MDPEKKAEWVRRLRSGRYKQAVGILCRRNRAGDLRYCCLGVLCEMAVRAGVIKRARGTFRGQVAYIQDGCEFTGFLPSAVVSWAGLDSDNPVVRTHSKRRTLSALNDAQVSFADIASIIEEQL